MHGITRLLDVIEMTLADHAMNPYTVYINVYENSLSVKWLAALNELIKKRYHLEKNYCFFGLADGPRNGEYLCDQINHSISAVNLAALGYQIDDYFSLDNTLDSELKIVHERFNRLHRYFEDLQGVSGALSPYYLAADDRTRWHIRQLNLLCHEFESWALSWRKKHTAPEWQRPSQLMCWLRAPRFTLDAEDYELFGIDTISRPLGGVFVGVNKAIGKHHWEVFQDEGRDSRVSELTTSTLRSQTEAAGDFDIEWAQDPDEFHWQTRQLAEFREWLTANGFDPEDPSLTIGHPQVGQVDLERSFGTTDYREIWSVINQHANVIKLKTSEAEVEYNYNWTDSNYAEQQIRKLKE